MNWNRGRGGRNFVSKFSPSIHDAKLPMLPSSQEWNNGQTNFFVQRERNGFQPRESGEQTWQHCNFNLQI